MVERERESWGGGWGEWRERERDSNSKSLFYKNCGLGFRAVISGQERDRDRENWGVGVSQKNRHTFSLCLSLPPPVCLSDHDAPTPPSTPNPPHHHHHYTTSLPPRNSLLSLSLVMCPQSHRHSRRTSRGWVLCKRYQVKDSSPIKESGRFMQSAPWPESIRPWALSVAVRLDLIAGEEGPYHGNQLCFCPPPSAPSPPPYPPPSLHAHRDSHCSGPQSQAESSTDFLPLIHSDDCAGC